jgi:hypothetical protein
VLHLEGDEGAGGQPAADVTVHGEAPAGWSMIYRRKTRPVLINRPDGVQIGTEVYSSF